jgi:NADPH-dependent ferric siderophore reductase
VFALTHEQPAGNPPRVPAIAALVATLPSHTTRIGAWGEAPDPAERQEFPISAMKRSF